MSKRVSAAAWMHVELGWRSQGSELGAGTFATALFPRVLFGHIHSAGLSHPCRRLQECVRLRASTGIDDKSFAIDLLGHHPRKKMKAITPRWVVDWRKGPSRR